MPRANPSDLRGAVVAAALAVLCVGTLVGGGPLLVDAQTATAYSWQVPPGGPPAAFYNVETGPFNALVDNPTALALVDEAFQIWQEVDTASIIYSDAGTLRDCSSSGLPNCSPGVPLDVEVNSLFQVFGVADGQSPIIFDEDGSIFSFLGLPPGVLAFASPEIITDGAPYAIVEGIAVFNGPTLADDVELIRAVMVHEFGHFSNLAHSVVNGQAILFNDHSGPSPFDPLGFGPPPIDSIETMYPFLDPLTSQAVQTPHRDDMTSLAAIYPGATPLPGGTITGEVLRADASTGISGVNVIARSIVDPFHDAVSALSGDFSQGAGPLAGNDGTYALGGLEGGSYIVFIDEIMQGGFSTPPVFGFEEECYNGPEESSDPLLDDPASCPSLNVSPTATDIDFVLQALPPDLSEPNDDSQSATAVACGELVSGVTIDPVGDLDYYAIDLQAQEELVVDIDAAVIGSPLDSLVGLFAPDGVTLLASNDDEAPFFTDSLLLFTAPTADRYFVAVTAWDDFNFDGSTDSGTVNLTTGRYQANFRCTPPPVPLDFETGRLLVDHQWQSVSFSGQFSDPIVIAGPASAGDNEEALVRIRDVSSAGFQIRLQEWDFQDGDHPAESVSYLVVERGRFVLPDGSQVEAGRLMTDNTGVGSFQSVDFQTPFPVAPIVLTTVGSQDDPSPVTTRVRGVSGSRFELTLQEEEAADQVHGSETIFYLAWQPGQGTTGATLVGTTAVPTLDYAVSTVAVSHLFQRLPSSSIEVQVQEERSADPEIGHLAESVGYLILGRYGQTPIVLSNMQTASGIDPAAIRWRQAELTFETGVVAINHIWKNVSLSQSFVNPVVIAQSPSYYGANSGVVRIRNVTSNSFEIHFQEWLYLDGLHALEEVAYLVVEAGSWELENGSQLQAGFVDTDQAGTASFLSVPFLQSHSTQPVVVASIDTFNGAQTVTTRTRNVGAESFEITMQEEEGLDQIHVSERIGFVAWEPGSGSLGGLPYQVSEIPATHEFAAVPTSWFELKIDEEQSVDPETDHGEERVGFFLLDGHLLAAMQTTNDPDPANLRWRVPLPGLEAGLVSVDHNWSTVTLEGQYEDPVIVARPATHNDADPGVLRLRNVTSGSFEIRFQEWLYLDGNHAPEQVAYLVMEAGRFFLPSGEQVEAGTVDLSNTGVNAFVNLGFVSAFPAIPAVVSSIVTFNGAQTATTRLRDVTNTGFQLTMQEEEANDQVHVVETISYVAWQPATGSAGSRLFEANTGFSANGAFTPLSYTQTFESTPCLLADMQTADGPDPANLRHRNPTSLGVEIQVDEESSADAETGHLFESIAFLAIDCAPVEATVAPTHRLLVSAPARSGPDLPVSNLEGLRFPVDSRQAPLREMGTGPNICLSDRLVFPWSLANLRTSGTPVLVEALLINPHDVAVEIEVIGLASDGSRVVFEHSLIQPREVRRWTREEFPREDLATLLIASGDRPLDGFVLITDSHGWVSSGMSARLTPQTEMHFPLFDHMRSDAFLFLFNPDREAAETELELVDERGQVTARSNHVVAAGGTLAVPVMSILEATDSRTAGYLRVRSSRPLQGRQEQRGILSEPARPVGGEGFSMAQAQGVDGGWSVLSLLNSGSLPARVDLEWTGPGAGHVNFNSLEIAPGAIVRIPATEEYRALSSNQRSAGYFRGHIENGFEAAASQLLAQVSMYGNRGLLGVLPVPNRSVRYMLAPIPSIETPALRARISLPGDGGLGSYLEADLIDAGVRADRNQLVASPLGEVFDLPFMDFTGPYGYIQIAGREPVLRGGYLYWQGAIIPLAESVQNCRLP